MDIPRVYSSIKLPELWIFALQELYVLSHSIPPLSIWKLLNSRYVHVPSAVIILFTVAILFHARASLAISGMTVVDRGRIVDGAVVNINGDDIEIVVDLGLGAGEAVAWGCDLTAEYVRINAEYTS